METKTENRRTMMTKKLLKSSLIELMKTKSIRNITIKEICETADVNRSTFYRHYDTQYELYEDIFNDVVDEIIRIVEQTASLEQGTTKMLTKTLEYVEENREIILVILSENASVNIGQAFSELVVKVIARRRQPLSEVSELEQYIVQFISAGMTNIIWLWLNNPDRRSAHDVAGVVNILMMNGLKRAVAFAGSAT